MSFTYSSELERQLLQVKKIAFRAIKSKEKVTKDLNGYVFLNSGKLLRPAIVILIGQALGLKNSNRLQKLAAAIEIIHSATLIHDDVIDKSAFRRDKKAVHELFGSATAILYGDYLLTVAIELLTQTGQRKILQTAAKNIHLMCEGEIEQLQLSGNPGISKKQYFAMIKKKTAGLFSCCCYCAALIAKAKPEVAKALAKFGSLAGIVYQILDDCRDYSSQPFLSGKKTGADLEEGRITLPLIYYFSRLGNAEKASVSRQITIRANHSILRENIVKSGGIEYSCELVLRILRRAEDCLQGIEPTTTLAVKPLVTYLRNEALIIKQELQPPQSLGVSKIEISRPSSSGKKVPIS